MSNWKELGEVPDSDDEGLDSQELPGDHDHAIESPLVLSAPSASPAASSPNSPDSPLSPPPADDDDIWSIPNSSQELQAPSQPVETARYDLPGKTSARTVLSPVDPPSSSGGGIAHGLDISISGGHDESSPLANFPVSSPPLQAENLRHNAQAASKSGTRCPSTSPRPPAMPRLEINIVDNSIPASISSPSRQVAVRLERSLRPRKPIQEHPYLLENAQYSNVMKSHGVRPLRVEQAPPERPSNRHVDDEFQQREYTAEESQPTADGDCSGPQADSMSPRLSRDFLDDIDELALSSSPTTSPNGPKLATSSQRSREQDTAGTSSGSDEEFPALADLNVNPLQGRMRKRKRPPPATASSASKRNQNDAAPRLLSPSPQFKRLDSHLISPNPKRRQLESSEAISSHRSTGAPSGHSLISSTSSPEVISSRGLVVDLVSDGDVSDRELEGHTIFSDSGKSTNGSGSDSDGLKEIQHHKKRIRGVLPASWLRLDQAKDRQQERKRQIPLPAPQTPDLVVRRGVAQPRQSSSGRIVQSLLFSDDSDDENVHRGTGNISANRFGQPTRGSDRPVAGDDLSSSDMEDDPIDMMASRRKRKDHSPLPTNRSFKRSKGAQSLSSDNTAQRTRQPKITKMLGRIGTRKSGASMSKDVRGVAIPSSKRPARAPSPPMLSILDVIEEGAPQFLRVAARTVKARADLGKARPHGKVINLGNRPDNVDALSALHDWKAGKIQARVPHVSSRPKAKASKPLQQSKGNTRRPRQQVLPHESTKLPDGTSLPVAADQENIPRAAQVRSKAPGSRRIGIAPKTVIRPAQLETTESVQARRRDFVSHKKVLDAIYRSQRSGRGSVIAGSIGSASNGAASMALLPAAGSRLRDEQSKRPLVKSTKEHSKQRPGFRKQFVPKSIDLTAARFLHAADPLPDEPLVSDETEQGDVHSVDKLVGLGPFGTSYTQHFEIFPLDPGVFFHESTLIGQGCLRRAIEDIALDGLRAARPSITFQLGERNLLWGPWNGSVASELGILLDWVVDQMQPPVNLVARSQAVGGVMFILDYTQKALSFSDPAQTGAFADRFLELVASFVKQADGIVLPDVLTPLIVSIFTVLQLCRHSGLIKEAFAAEDVLKSSAAVCMRKLLPRLNEIRAVYEDQQILSLRERGIGNNRSSCVSWVVLISTLEAARIPRTGFWDVVHSVMVPPELKAMSNAEAFEKLWCDMFSLLPLVEFDNSGMVVEGRRHTAPVEGWKLPQQIISRVFSLYKSNAQQSPSFNAYCRALVSRCHYLVQQWGWRTCGGILGTIFDFFGTRQLAHLRNEEVYSSPRFLDQLPESPQLLVEQDDRCFHIFVKMLGLVITRLRRLGHIKDISNIIARTLPNHDRQHLKEDTVRQSDIAALRNHHDLLCTLFWAAPKEQRPSVHLIEKLVIPSISHKEACLINLRAWRQLARFVVASNEGIASYRPFISWQNNVFQQVLDQYNSVASNVQREASALSKDKSRDIDRMMMEKVITSNKAATMDVLLLSMTASLDVLKQAKHLGAATYCLNMHQLDQVFTKLDLSSSTTDWSILMPALDALDHFIDMLEQAMDHQYSFDADEVDPTLLEEAILALDRNVASSTCQLARTISCGSHDKALMKSSKRAACVERAIIVAAKLASRLIHARVAQVSGFFRPGAHNIFETVPQKLVHPQRKYLPLFLATLFNNNVFDLKDVGTSISELWILSLVKPSKLLGYENQLAEALGKHDLPFLPEALPPPGATPNYKSNRDLFAFAISSMRRSVRSSQGAERQQLKRESAATLRGAMTQMKADLESLRADPAEHEAYMSFVREVISLIKSHGGDFCNVDQFFYQVSADYWPPLEDPQLQAAGIAAYGIRLAEGDATATPRLFHYLYSSFRNSMANDRLAEQSKIIEKAMDSPDILTFVLGIMLPASIQASVETEEMPLLETYTDALHHFLTRSDMCREIDEANAEHVVGLLRIVLWWLQPSQRVTTGTFSSAEAHIMGLLCRLANDLQPSMLAFSYLPLPARLRSQLNDTARALADVARNAASHIGRITDAAQDNGGEAQVDDMSPEEFVGFDESVIAAESVGSLSNEQVKTFADHMVADVKKGWTTRRDVGGTGAEQGRSSVHEVGVGSRPGLVLELYKECKALEVKWTRLRRVETDVRASRVRG